MSGADWDKILSGSETLNFEGKDLDDIVERLGLLEEAEREDLVRAIDAEKAKVKVRGDLVDTALDVLKSVLGALAA